MLAYVYMSNAWCRLNESRLKIVPGSEREVESVIGLFNIPEETYRCARYKNIIKNIYSSK